VGLGWRPAIAAALLSAPEQVGFVEVVAEAALAQPHHLRELEATTAIWPVIPHGVKLSLASPDGLRPERLTRLATVATRLRAPCVSEHIAITRGDDVDIGHLTPVRRTRARVAVIAENIRTAQAGLPVPLLVENIAAPFAYHGDVADDALDELEEGAFYHAVVAATGCGLLLDLSNLYANARNAGQDPVAHLHSFPLHATRMIHIAGGVIDDSGFYHDTHAHPVPEAVFAILAEALRHTGPVPILLERDADFDDVGAIFAELDRCRALLAAAPTRPQPSSSSSSSPSSSSKAFVVSPQERAAMVAVDRALALALTADDDADDADDADAAAAAAAGIDVAGLRRTRHILRRKRVDDAMPLLPRLALRPEAWVAAANALAGFRRQPANNAVRDAWRIADVVAHSADVYDDAIVDDAIVDGLLLRARFQGDPTTANTSPRRRVLPFVGRAGLRGGGRATALKGPGADASIRVHAPSSQRETPTGADWRPPEPP
jgi:uncharacterized protein (UPF0276 family)